MNLGASLKENDNSQKIEELNTQIKRYQEEITKLKEEAFTAEAKFKEEKEKLTEDLKNYDELRGELDKKNKGK